MAVSDYYTSDDLLVRRTSMANWICDQLNKFVNYYHYGTTIIINMIIQFMYTTLMIFMILKNLEKR